MPATAVLARSAWARTTACQPRDPADFRGLQDLRLQNVQGQARTPDEVLAGRICRSGRIRRRPRAGFCRGVPPQACHSARHVGHREALHRCLGLSGTSDRFRNCRHPKHLDELLFWIFGSS